MAGKRAVSVQRAVRQGRVADRGADRDVLTEDEARQLRNRDGAGDVRHSGRAVAVGIPLRRLRNVRGRQVRQAEPAIGVAIGLGPDEVGIEPVHLVEAGSCCSAREQHRTLVLEDAAFEAPVGIVGQTGERSRDRRSGIDVQRLRDAIVERQHQIARLHLRPELALGQVRIIGDDVDVDGRIAGAVVGFQQRRERVMAVKQVELAVRSDHDRLDVGQQRRLQVRWRDQVPAGDLGVDLGKALIHLRRQDLVDRNRVKRERSRLDRACVARIVCLKGGRRQLAHAAPLWEKGRTGNGFRLHCDDRFLTPLRQFAPCPAARSCDPATAVRSSAPCRRLARPCRGSRPPNRRDRSRGRG